MSGSMTLRELTRVVGGIGSGKADELRFSSVSTDSRNLQKGELFIALQGPNFDGNKFVEAAAENGAAAALVSEWQADSVEQIVVDDTHKALANLAVAWRKEFKGPLVGITGSNGKTTVKEMVTAIFSECGQTLATKGNLNNDIGVPLTLLRLQPEHQYAVIEMGANHRGEIDYTAKIAKPDIAVITNAAAAHLAGFGDLEGVANTKGEIVSALSDRGVAVLNRDDTFYDKWEALAAGREIISFGFSEKAQVRSDIDSISFSLSEGRFKTVYPIYWNNKKVEVSLSLAGNHNVKNSLAAAAACLAAGCSLEQVKAGLESMLPVKGRLCPLTGLNGAAVIDDSYNANPSSCSAALDLLANIKGEKWMALGAFAELGAQSMELHSEIGREIKDKGIKKLFAVGEEAKQAVEGFGENGYWFEEQDALIASLKEKLSKDVVVLVKGSRGQKMERVVEALLASNEIKEKGGNHAALVS